MIEYPSPTGGPRFGRDASARRDVGICIGDKEVSLLNGGYFRAHMYTCVPRHIREDLTRMEEAGAEAVTVSVLEQDVFAAVENLRIIHQTARDLGMRMYADIARWGGLVSGTPKVPSLWPSLRPETWKRHADGRPVPSFGDLAPTSSVFHPDTFAFFREYLERMFEVVPFDGLFWNEPKTLHIPDHSAAAVDWFRERDLDIQDAREHARAHAAFFGRLNVEARRMMPSVDIGCFLMPTTRAYAEPFAAMPELNTFGCDGRAWRHADEKAPLAYKDKCLPDLAPPFMELARRHGLKTFAFIENIDVPDAYLPVLDRGLPETLGMGFDHVLYYYYGRSVESPDRCMEIMFRHLRSAAAGEREVTSIA